LHFIWKKNENLECQFYTTEYARHGIELAQMAANNKFNIIVAVGGVSAP
jgi:diacylglycerol kinase family enzyme